MLQLYDIVMLYNYGKNKKKKRLKVIDIIPSNLLLYVEVT